MSEKSRITIIVRLYYVIFMFLIVRNVEAQKNNKTFFNNLPIGEYRINVKIITMCNSTQHNSIQLNWRLNKISPTKTVIVGNVTLEVPLDDTLSVIIHFDQSNANGRWSNNIMVFKKEKACTSLRLLLKEEYYMLFGWDSNKILTCPLPAMSVYVLKGLPANNFDEILRNIPKVLMYGTYRLRLKFMDKDNEQIGCLLWIWDVKRPWESP